MKIRFYSTSSQLEEQGHDIYLLDREIHLASRDLAKITMEVLGEFFSGTRQTMNWLTACARLLSAEGQPVAWITPIGIPVLQTYRQKKPSRL